MRTIDSYNIICKLVDRTERGYIDHNVIPCYIHTRQLLSY